LSSNSEEKKPQVNLVTHLNKRKQKSKLETRQWWGSKNHQHLVLVRPLLSIARNKGPHCKKATK
jgi:hypothetical protein